MSLNEKAAGIVARSVREAHGLLRRRGRTPAAAAPRPSCARQLKLDELATRCRKVVEQIDRRVRGLKITDRLVSIADPDARPIRKGQARQADRVRLRGADL